MDVLTEKLRLAKYTKSLQDGNFTLKKISEISGIKLTMLQAIFYQGYSPSAKILLPLAKALDIDPLDIFQLARKLTPEMEDKLFSEKDILERLYQNTYWIDAGEFPDSINKIDENSKQNITVING